MQQQKNCEIKFHNSFSIGGVDITRHANSPGRTQNEHFSERNALSTQNCIKTSKKNNSNMAYNDSWSTWEQKGRAEPRREKNTWRVKTTRRTCGRGRVAGARRPPANKFAIAFDSNSRQSRRSPHSPGVDSSDSSALCSWLHNNLHSVATLDLKLGSSVEKTRYEYCYTSRGE